MYAIVDIESTGSPASKNGITEIAIVTHDGQKITGNYETLVNPMVQIPPYVVRLTSITNEMVASAPTFEKVAHEIYNLLKGHVFVAHNADFDYHYLQYFLSLHGYDLQEKRLCTFQLSKKAFPNLTKHGLGSLTTELDIHLVNHHRAGGDAMATAMVFDLILKSGGSFLINSMIIPPVKNRLLQLQKTAKQ